MDGYSESLGSLIKGAWSELADHWIRYTGFAFLIGLTLNQIRHML